MERENRNLKVLVVILCVLVLALGGYFFYDKVLSDDGNANNNDNIKDNINDIQNDDVNGNNNDNIKDNINDTQNDDVNGNNVAVNLTKEEANIIVKNIMDKFYDEVFYGHSYTYCGGYDQEDVIHGELVGVEYYRSITYNSLDELKKHLNTYMSSSLIENMLEHYNIRVPNYKEKDNKLYCFIEAKGYLVYDKENSSYDVLKFTDSTINANANVSALSSGGPYPTISATLSIEKIDGIWVLSSYAENQS